MRNLGLTFLIILFNTGLYSQTLKERILSVMDQNKELNNSIKTLNVKNSYQENLIKDFDTKYQILEEKILGLEKSISLKQNKNASNSDLKIIPDSISSDLSTQNVVATDNNSTKPILHEKISETMYYSKDWKVVGTLGECEYIRKITFDYLGNPIGEIFDYYKSGELQSKSEAAKSIDKVDDHKSIFTGKGILYYKNGRKEQELTRNLFGKFIGDLIYYYESGPVKTIQNFDSNGVLNSEKHYHENGKISNEFQYKNGGLNGIANYYSEDGKKYAELEYENDKPKYDWYIAFDESGKAYKYDIKTNKPFEESKQDDNVAVANKINEKEIKSFFRDGSTYQYYIHNGISITMSVSIERNYGKYYVANISIENLTGESFDFFPDEITAKFWKNKNLVDAEVYSNDEYMKKVNNKQNWNAALYAFNESFSASQAGYSKSSTTSRTNSYSTSYGSASGYDGKNYSNFYGSSQSYGTSRTRSYSQSYNGAANYAAQQNANNNINNYVNQLYNIKSVLNEGYLKTNTLENEQRIDGYINVGFQNAEKIYITVPINGINYGFEWNN